MSTPEDELAKKFNLIRQDLIDDPKAADNPWPSLNGITNEQSPNYSRLQKSSTDFSMSYSKLGASDEDARSPLTKKGIIAVVLFFVLAMFVWIMPIFFRQTSIWYRLIKDIFICILLSQRTGLKFTTMHPKEGLHLFIPNIITAGQVACWAMMLVTSISKMFEDELITNFMSDCLHVSRYLIFCVQTFLAYPIWTNHLKHKHTPAEKYVGFIIFVYFFSDLVGNMCASFNGLPDFNGSLVIIMSDKNSKGEAPGQVFLGVAFQAVTMWRWNLAWIFFDITLGRDFHRDTRHSRVLRETDGRSLMSLNSVGRRLRMGENNMVEVWIVGTWSAFGMLHLWLPGYDIWCNRAIALFALFAMVLILLGDSKRMRRHQHSSIFARIGGFWPWTISLLGALTNWTATIVYFVEKYKKKKKPTFIEKLKDAYLQVMIYELITMLAIFVIIFKGATGIMGWRRQILVSTLLAFLITLLVFELVEQFEATDSLVDGHEVEHHSASHSLKHVTMWLWPEFIIDTIEYMVTEQLPVSY